jgi:hypothetical protein
MECLDCKRPMRRRTDSSEELPGTVRMGGRGLCATCHQRRDREGCLDELPTMPPGRPRADSAKCLTCGRAIRPGSTTLEEWPDTVRGVYGRCQMCHALHLKDITPERVAHTAATLNAYLAWRRPYRERAGVS